MILTDHQLERYARQLVLREIGGAGQAKLRAAHVTLIGAGGIGCPALQYLAAAGVGTLRVIEDDTVALANLQRQILFGTDNIGVPKLHAAAHAVARLNPDVAFEPRPARIDAANAPDLLTGTDLVLDGSDNFATRLAVSDACVALRLPLVSAALGMFQAQIATWRGWTDGPCYRCFVGDAFDCDDVDTCAEVGVLGAMAGVAGSWAALEAMRAIVGFGDDAGGKLHVFDGLKPSLRTIRVPKDLACKGCGENRP